MKKLLVLTFASLLATAGHLSAGEETGYVGTVDPPVPKDCQVLGAGIVTGYGKETIGYKRFFCKTASVFWLQQLVDEQKLKWRVIDVLSIPRNDKYGVLLSGEDRCVYSAEPGSWVIAYGDYGHIIKAWTMPANPSQKTFRPVPASQVTCEFEDHSD